VLPALGVKEAEVPRDEGPLMVGSAKAMFEEDKMLLNCLEYFSHMKTCCLIDLLFCETNFCLGSCFVEGLDSSKILGGNGAIMCCRVGRSQCPATGRA
jgi:hypothetical protein